MWGDWEPKKDAHGVEAACSKTCGLGTRTMTRSKKVTEMHGGSCTGESEEEQSCNEKECAGM